MTANGHNTIKRWSVSHISYSPELEEIVWEYQVRRSDLYGYEHFPDLDHLNSMLQKGEAFLWNPDLQAYDTLTWKPCQVAKWQLEEGQYRIADYNVRLFQPFLESEDKVWKWRMWVWKDNPYGIFWYEVQLAESQFKRILRNPRKASAYLERK